MQRSREQIKWVIAQDTSPSKPEAQSQIRGVSRDFVPCEAERVREREMRDRDLEKQRRQPLE